MNFQKISCQEINGNPFSLIGHDWALLCAGNESGFNMMTVSWGQVGVLWNKNVATAYVRPQRHTRKFCDESDTFTLSFFGEEKREVLKLCGAKSGRDIDKMHMPGLTPAFGNGAVFFEEAKLVLICRKLYTGKIVPEGFCDSEALEKNYPAKDFHIFYTGEISEVLQRLA